MNLYILHYFLPIPFMALYSWKTDRFDKYWEFRLIAPIICMSLLLLKTLYDIYGVFFVNWILTLLYTLLIILGTELFLDKCHLPQALSLAFNLAFFNSVYWETPIHVYTALYHGYIDAAFPLHVIYILPFFFLYQKIRFPKPHRKQYALFCLGLLISTLFLLPVIIFYNPDIWSNPVPSWASLLWYINRFVSYAILCKLFLMGESLD